MNALHHHIEKVLGERLFHLLRYLISGGMAAISNIGALFLLVQFGNFHYLSASILAYLFGIVVSFTLQKFWTFQDKPTHDLHAQFARYMLVVLCNLLLNTSLMYLLVSQLGLWYILAQILATAVVAIIGYYAYKHFVFTERVTATITP